VVVCTQIIREDGSGLHEGHDAAHATQQEGLEACRRKLDQANRFRTQLRQAVTDAQAEIAAICFAMGEGAGPCQTGSAL
jgi:hypothetical protein